MLRRPSPEVAGGVNSCQFLRPAWRDQYLSAERVPSGHDETVHALFSPDLIDERGRTQSSYRKVTEVVVTARTGSRDCKMKALAFSWMS